MSKPLLSIGMIVKDEIRCIERCLKALQPLRDAVPCELVIADTGSTDGTREIAAQYADALFDFEWINDFAAARNAVMDRCSGKWHFTVDADEYLDPDISELTAFLTTKQPKHVVFASVVGRNYGSVEMKEDKYTDFITLRLARTDQVRYVGAVHEHWPTKPGQMSEVLKHTILHHDGYAGDLGKRAEEKHQRNMELLREELRENPNNLQLLLQCVESSYTAQLEQMDYLHRGMKLLMDDFAQQQSAVAAAFCRYAVRIALINKIPEAEEWLTWGEERFAQSIFFRMDVALTAALYYLNHENYEKALPYGEQYLSGYADYRSGSYNLAEVTVSTVGLCLPEHNIQARQLVARCQMKLGRERQALETLRQDTSIPESWNLVKNELVLLADLQETPETEVGAEQLCAELMDQALAANHEDKEKWDLRTACLAVASQMFADGEGEKWRLFRQVSGDLGLAAQAMDETEAEPLSALLNRLTRWKEVSNPVILHAIECGVPLPDGFYRKGADSLRNTAAALGERPGLAQALLRWRKTDDFTASMTKFQFLFELAAAALRGYDYSDADAGLALAELFVQVAADYLPNYYNSALLADLNDCAALPGLHRFALVLLNAWQARAQGDELGYIRLLRVALELAPAMKRAVDFLLEQHEQRRRDDASPELRQLAEKVRAILAQYAPDDPAVAELKASKAYQKVAYLLEGGGAI